MAAVCRQGCYDLNKAVDRVRALDLCQQAVAITGALAAANPNDVRARLDEGFSYSDLARVLSDQGDSVRSLEAWRKALAIDQVVAAADPKDARPKVSLGTVYERAGWLLAKAGAPGGLDYALKSLEIRKELYDADPANLGRLEALSSSYAKLGDVEVMFASTPKVATGERARHWRQTRSWHEQALEILLRLRSNSVLRRANLAEPDRIAQEIVNCDVALGKRPPSPKPLTK